MNGQEYDPHLAFLIICLIPVAYWWHKQKCNSEIRFWGYFLIGFFSKGSIELSGLVNVTMLRYCFELPIIFFYLSSLSKKHYFPTNRIIVILFIGVSVISSANTSVLMLVLFLLKYLEVFMLLQFFYSAFNFNEHYQITKLFVGLSIAQIFANIIKYFIVGVTEPYIGTMSAHEGGFTTVFSLCGFCVSLVYYLSTKNKRYLALLLGFILFGIIGGKRALTFYFPIFFVVTYFAHLYFSKKLRGNILVLLVGVALFPLLFYFMCRSIPSLNPDGTVGGQFDFDYVMDYQETYRSGENDQYDNVGREEAITFIFDRLVDSDLYTMMFGYGSGVLVPTRFNSDGVAYDTRIEKYGVGYSSGIGSVALMIQVGIVGAILYFSLFVFLLVSLLRKFKSQCQNLSENGFTYCMSAIMCLIIALFISVTYSSVPLQLTAPCILIMWWVAGSLKILNNNNQIY